MELVYLADTVIATVERVVDELERSTDGVIIPQPGCDLVVEAPGGAAPTSCYPLYPVDGEEILRYTEACNAGRFQEYLGEFSTFMTAFSCEIGIRALYCCATTFVETWGAHESGLRGHQKCRPINLIQVMLA